MVLGGCDGSSGPRCSPRGVWRSLPGAGQQPPSVHADPLGQDRARAHEHTDPVQLRPVPARLQLPGPAQPVVLPQRSQSGAALHGTREKGRGEEGGGGAPFQTFSAGRSGDDSSTKTEAGSVQAPEPALSAAPHTSHHQQTHRLRWPAPTPEAPAALLTGLSLQGLRSGWASPESLQWSIAHLKEKKLSNGPFAAVRDAAASAAGGQLGTYWTQGGKICTDSVDADVSGFRRNLKDWMAKHPRRKVRERQPKKKERKRKKTTWEKRSTVIRFMMDRFTLITSECT